MKTIEEKAEAYDKSLERAKSVIEQNPLMEYLKKGIEYIFPELKESEDERIRKALIDHYQGDGCICNNEYRIDYKDIRAWLEKQSESDETKAKMFLMNKGYPIDANGTFPTYEEMYNIIRDGLEKQGEQKSIDGLSPQEAMDIAVEKCFEQGEQKPIEPKFKNGQWIVWQDKCYKVNYNGCGYELVDQNGLSTSLEYGTVDESAHLWDITKDAKDGDVLANNFHEIFIFKNIKEDSVISYCSIIDRTSGAIVNSFDEMGVGYTSVVNFCPATKEQRDTLFTKTKEAGYEWDAEKKELKKVKEEPAWSEEDEEMRKNIEVRLHTHHEIGISEFMKSCYWFKSIKDRVQPKQEWSEEDEKMCQETIDWFEKKCFPYALESENPARESIDWLKSLRPQNRWKPSDEQMEALDDAIAICSERDYETECMLDNLRQELKKLREE